MNDANLICIQSLKEKFDCIIGYSDHTNGIEVPALAYAAGAQIIEKHYRINEDQNCIDAPVSITEFQMRKLINKISKIDKIFGIGELSARPAEKETLAYRRHSLFNS